MALRRCLLELGTGVDLHGKDSTKAARRAVFDALRHSSVAFPRVFGYGPEMMVVEVNIAVPHHDTVNLGEVLLGEDSLALSEVLCAEDFAKLGAIAVGREADLSVMDLVDDDWIYRDSFEGTLRARHEALAPRFTVRAGRVFKPAFGPRPWGWLPERADRLSNSRVKR